MTVPQPLRGRLVVDMSQYIAGSACGQLLADFGAEVVKVEPPSGDPARGLSKSRFGSVYFRNYNTGKSSQRLDLSHQEGRAEFESLLARADALVMNFSLATIEKLGLDWPSLHARHPHLVVTAVTSYGLDDSRTAFDTIAQVVSGFGHVNADVDGTPRVSAGYPTDVLSGLYAGTSTAMALLDPSLRNGVLIDAAMVEVAMSALCGPMAMLGAEDGAVAPGRGNRDVATCPSTIFACADGYAYVYAGLDHHWERLAPVVGGPSGPLAERLADPERFEAPVAAWARRRTVADVCAATAELGIPAGPVSDPITALTELRSTRPGAVLAMEVSGEAVPQFPVTFSGARIDRTRAPSPVSEREI